MPDEELPQPPGRSASRSRLLWAAVVLVAVVIIAAAVARIATHSSPQSAPATVTVPPSSGPATSSRVESPAPSATRPTAASKPPAVLPVLRRLTSAAIDRAHGECPRLASTCTTTGETPAAVTTGLRSAFAKADVLVAVSDIAYNPGAGPRLAYRLLSAHAGRLTITVELRPLAAGDGTGSQASTEDPGHVVRFQTVARGLSVEVQISAPTARYIDLGRMQRLAVDPRLLATG